MVKFWILCDIYVYVIYFNNSVQFKHSINSSEIVQKKFVFFGIGNKDDSNSDRVSSDVSSTLQLGRWSFGQQRYGFENQSAVRFDDNTLMRVDNDDFPLSKSSPFCLRWMRFADRMAFVWSKNFTGRCTVPKLYTIILCLDDKTL